jgi:hypothetical protein
MQRGHSTRIMTMWDSSKISGKLGCNTSRLMFGTRENKTKQMTGERLYHTFCSQSVCPHYPQSPSETFLTNCQQATVLRIIYSTYVKHSSDCENYKGNRQGFPLGCSHSSGTVTLYCGTGSDATLQLGLRCLRTGSESASFIHQMIHGPHGSQHIQKELFN